MTLLHDLKIIPEQESQFIQAILKGDVPEVRRIAAEEGTKVLNTTSAACVKHHITPLMLAVLSANEEMPEVVLNLYPQAQRAAEIDKRMYDETNNPISLLGLAIISGSSVKFNRLKSLQFFSSDQINHLKTFRDGSSNIFNHLAPRLTVEGLSLLRSLFNAKELELELTQVLIEGRHFLICLIQGSQDIQMLDAIIQLYANPKLLNAQLETEGKSVLLGAINSGKKAIWDRVISLWPQLRKHIPTQADESMSVLQRVAASTDDPDFFDTLCSYFSGADLIHELTRESSFSKNVITTALAHGNYIIARRAFDRLSPETQAKILGRNPLGKMLPLSVLSRNSPSERPDIDATTIIRELLALYPTPQHRRKALYASCYTRNYRQQDLFNDFRSGENVFCDEVYHLLELLSVQGEWEAIDYLFTHYEFPITLVKDGHFAALNMFEDTPVVKHSAGLNRYTKALLLRACNQQRASEIVFYCKLLKINPVGLTAESIMEGLSEFERAILNWRMVSEKHPEETQESDRSNLDLVELLDKQDAQADQERELPKDCTDSYLKFSNFRLTGTQQYKIKSLLDTSFFESLGEVEPEMQLLACYAATNPMLYYEFEALFKKSDIHNGIILVGELLGHPEPMNPTQSSSRIAQMHDAHHVLVVENNTIVSCRKGMLNITIDNQPDYKARPEDVRIFIRGLLHDKKEQTEQKLRQQGASECAQFAQMLAQCDKDDQKPQATDLGRPFTELLQYREYTPATVNEYIQLFGQARLLNSATLTVLKQTDHQELPGVLKTQQQLLENLQKEVKAYCGSHVSLAACLEACRGHISKNDNRLNFYHRKALTQLALRNGNLSFIKTLEPDYEEIFESLLKTNFIEPIFNLLPAYGQHVSMNHANFLLNLCFSRGDGNLQLMAKLFEHLPLASLNIMPWVKAILSKSHLIANDQCQVSVLNALRPLFFRMDFEEQLSLQESKTLFAAVMMTDDVEYQALVLLRTAHEFAGRRFLNREYFFMLATNQHYTATMVMAKSATPGILSVADLRSAATLTNCRLVFNLNFSMSITSVLNPATPTVVSSVPATVTPAFDRSRMQANVSQVASVSSAADATQPSSRPSM